MKSIILLSLFWSGQSREATRPSMIYSSSQYSRQNFMLLGFTKCGTTSFFKYMMHHPQVSGPCAYVNRSAIPGPVWATSQKMTTELVCPGGTKKEAMSSFIKKHGLPSDSEIFGHNYDKHYITRHMPRSPHNSNFDLTVGDFSACTYFGCSSDYGDKGGGTRLASHLHTVEPNLKAIAVICDPAVRQRSYCRMIESGGDSFEECFSKGLEELAKKKCVLECKPGEARCHQCVNLQQGGGAARAIVRGRYVDLIEPWVKIFGRDNVLVVDMAQFEHEGSAAMNRIHHFLGLGDFEYPPEIFHSRANIAKDDRISSGHAARFSLTNQTRKEYSEVDSKLLHISRKLLYARSIESLCKMHKIGTLSPLHYSPSSLGEVE